VSTPFIPVNTPLLDGNEADYLAECIRTGWISSEGPFIKRFEQAMAEAAGRRHGIAVTNGSVALDIAIHALGLEKGSEVIIPTFTIISCAAAIVRAGQQRFVHEELGWNARMTNLQAALGVAQVERLPRTVELKRRIGRLYDEHLGGLNNIRRPVARTSYADNIYWVYGVVLSDDVPFDAKEAIRRLGEKGIGTRPFFWCMHEQPVLRRMGLMLDESHPNAECIARRGFYLPSGLGLTDDEIARSAQALKEILS
jgi:dTDP-4-amino-4,6-dideoxygalactose transaminase